MDDTTHKLATEWVKLSYYLPITWETYVKAPLTLRHSWFAELAEIRKEMAGKGSGPFSGQTRGDKKLGLE